MQLNGVPMPPVNFDTIRIGDERELVHTITAQDVERFADATGDRNPLHLDEDFAKRTPFQRPVVYGMLSASFLSTVIGTLMPGPGALWLSQTLQFLHQAYVGDTIRVAVRVKQKSPATRILVLETVIANQANQVLMTGEARVRLLNVSARGESSTNSANAMVVLITGARRGIGAAIARVLASDGHKVVVNYLHGEEDALRVVKDIADRGGEAIAVCADISKEDEVGRLFAVAAERLGPIQGLVHAAARPIHLQAFADMTWESAQEHLDVQVKGAFLCAQAAVPQMIAVGGGAIVMIGSVAADAVPPAQQTGYAVAKAALAALARSLAAELGPKNIRVNVVSPGMTHTDMLAELPERAKELTRMQTPLRRLGQPEDVARAVAFLLSPGARHITGENLRVCGGSVMA